MIQMRTLLTTLVLTAIWSQAPFNQSKAAAEVELPDDLNSLRRSLSEAGYEIRLQKPHMEGAYGLVNKKSKTIWIAPIAQ